MKIQTTLLCGLLLSTPVFAAPINNKSSINQQVGYSFGYLMGRSNAESIQDLDLDAFVQGLREASKGQAASLSDEDMARVLTQYKRQAEAKQLLEVKQLADKNAKIGAAFLAENAKKPEVKTTASGLQYMVLQQGQGKSPKANSKVKVHYEGRLIDQTVFDSSIARQQPAEFQVSQVIQGWTLLGSNDTIEVIAVKNGFANGNYFAKVFRRYTKMTPGEYRCKRTGQIRTLSV